MSTQRYSVTPHPIEAIRFRMEQEGLRQKDLENTSPEKTASQKSSITNAHSASA